MHQLLAQDLSPSVLSGLRAAYNLAERLADGLYRPTGATFLSHLTRTASITVYIDPSPAMVSAALLHASYSLHRFRIGKARRELRRVVGAEVELLIRQYEQLPWNSAEAVQTHQRQLDGYPDLLRRAMLLRLANELEDHLDGADWFLKNGLSPSREAGLALCPGLARQLGVGWLAEDLEAALAVKVSIPGVLQRDRQFAYSTSWRNLPELPRLRQALRKLASRLPFRSDRSFNE